MTTMKNVEDMLSGRTLAESIVGDTLVYETHNRGTHTKTLVQVTRSTPKQIVVDGDHRFWSSGNNYGQEVGRSSKWSYKRGSRTVRVPLSGDEIESIQKEMKVQEKKAKVANEKSVAEAVARSERRALRFEGRVADRATALKTLAVDLNTEMEIAGLDETSILGRFKITVERQAFRMRRIVWDLESNEKDLRSYIVNETSDLEQNLNYLSRDLHMSYRSSDRIVEGVAKRQSLIEAGKEAIYLANSMLGVGEEKE